jgi:hypothetical protein
MKTTICGIFALFFLASDCWAEKSQLTSDHYCPSRYQLVAGEYDVKIKTTGSSQTEYETHKTMFLIDTYSGKVWLFLAEKDMFQGRWGWIPARGLVERESTEKKIE